MNKPTSSTLPESAEVEAHMADPLESSEVKQPIVIKVVNSRKFWCPLCAQDFHYKRNVNAHITAVHANQKAFQCFYCPFSSNRLSGLKGHNKKTHQ
jgi:hypothetical protein